MWTPDAVISVIGDTTLIVVAAIIFVRFVFKAF